MAEEFKGSAIDPQLIEQFNKDARAWTKYTRTLLIQKLGTYGLKKKIETYGDVKMKSLMSSIRAKTNKRDGAVDRISFSFNYYGMMIPQGVGRGVPLSLAPGKRRKIEWYKTVLKHREESLADIVAEYFGDEYLNTIKLGVNRTKSWLSQ